MAFTNTLIDSGHPGPYTRTWDITVGVAGGDLVDTITHDLGFDPTFFVLTPRSDDFYADTWYVSAHSAATIAVTRVNNSTHTTLAARLTCGRIHAKR
jgi:hypothetical protein